MAAQRLFVLDINDNTVAGLTAEVHRNSYAPVAAHVVSPQEGVSVEESVRTVVGRCDAEGLNCHISLSPSTFSFRSLKLPFIDRKKIDEVLHYELIDSMGVGDQPIYYDAIHGTVNEDRTSLLAAVISGDELDRLMTIIGDAALAPLVITVSGLPLVLQMVTSGYGADRPAAYLDAGRFDSSVFACKGGSVVSVRSFRGVGAEQLSRLGDEVRRTLLALDIGGDCPIFIGGAAGSDTETAKRFREQSGLEDVVLVDIEEDPAVEDSSLARLPLHLRSKLSSLLQVDPADKRLINLVPKSDAGTIGLQAIKRHAPVLAACLLLLLGWVGYQLYDYNRIAQKRAVLTEQAEQIFMQTLDGRVPKVDPVRELRAEIGAIEQSASASLIGDPEMTAVAVLSDLSGRIPSTVQVGFDRFSFDRRQVQIDGRTDAYSDVDTIRKSIAGSNLYSVVTIDSARTAKNGDGVRFSLKLEL